MAAAEASPRPPVALLSLENVLLTPEQLARSPSLEDGVPAELEYDLRIWGCQFIQELGICLRLPQIVFGTAQILFQRFYYRKSMVHFSVENIALAALFLASKLEEQPRRPRDMVNAYHYFKCKRKFMPHDPLDLFSSTDYDLQKEMFQNEKHILRELAFNVHVQHPHKLVINYLQVLRLLDSAITQRAWNYVNDAFRTTLLLRYQPNVVATAAAYLAARDVSVVLPEDLQWWQLFDATQSDVEDAARSIMHVYTRQLDGTTLPVSTRLLAEHLARGSQPVVKDKEPSEPPAKRSRWDKTAEKPT